MLYRPNPLIRQKIKSTKLVRCSCPFLFTEYTECLNIIYSVNCQYLFSYWVEPKWLLMIRIFLHCLSVQEYLWNVDLGRVLHITDSLVKTISVGNFELLVDIAKNAMKTYERKKWSRRQRLQEYKTRTLVRKP